MDHLLEGQKCGKNFDHLFGDNPQEYSKHLVDHLQKNSWKAQMKFIVSIFLIALLIRAVGLINGMPTLTQILLDLVIFPLIVLIFTFLFLKLNKWTAFKNSTGMIVVSVIVIQVLSIFYNYIKGLLI
ncbi:hypothetical protein HMPREF3291_00750 [Bacillus sp. HMSC76G11]|nr:hypothetical protein HMPREF3291_00750 [Bacillus sp. HMSC76G11]